MNNTQKRKRICFFALDMNERGGMQRVVVELANEMFPLYEVHILTFPSKNDSIDIPYEIKDSSVKIAQVCSYKDFFLSSKVKNYFLIIKSIREYVKNNKIDCFVSVGMGTILWSCLGQLGLSCRYICCDHTSFFRKESWAVRGRFLSKVFADDIVVLTQRDAVAWNSKKVCVIHNPSPFADAHMLAPRDIAERENKVIALGRLVEVKGFERLLDIWNEFQHNEPNNYTLEIIGEGPLENNLKNKIINDNIANVSIKAYTPNVSELYSNAKVQVLTSYYEGLSMVLIEGLSFGLPAVAYDVPSGPAEVIEDGHTGFLVKDGDKQVFINKLRSLMNDNELRRMSEECIIARERFNPEKILHDWDLIFNRKK